MILTLCLLSNTLIISKMIIYYDSGEDDSSED